MTVTTDLTQCRVCGSRNIAKAGSVEYYSGFAWPIYDCRECLCRFTKHDEYIYNTLHSEAGSCYNVYRGLLERCKKAFKDGDLGGLKRDLCQASKYKFIIKEVERGPRNARLLEIGCSRGYLTSYFILAGYQITGVDISESAVESARAAFGDHFVLTSDASVDMGAPYDVIYHIGTIGCVADPLGLTRRLLSMLKPGGRLLFNSPNLQSCWLSEQLWIDAAPPPDLVSMFPPGFWGRHFAGEAQVEEQIENCEPDRGLAIGLRKLFGREWKRPAPIPLDESSGRYIGGIGDDLKNGRRRRIGDEVWQIFEKSILKLCRNTGLSRFAPAQPTEFGIFVRMTRTELTRACMS